MNRKSYILVAAIGIALFVITSGCNSIGQKSPSEVVVAAYMAGNEGAYSEAEKYVSSEVISAMKSGLGALVGGLKGYWDETTRNGTIQKIEILTEKVRGEGANVSFRIHFKDKIIKYDHELLIKEGGQWKISMG